MEGQEYCIDCTGDVVKGDHIRFSEAVFALRTWGRSKWNRRRNDPAILGDRIIEGIVVTDSYEDFKQQHTFTIVVTHSEGYEPFQQGKKLLRKGRNVYRNGTLWRSWKDENARTAALEEKHERGKDAREDRRVRREIEASFRI